MKRRGFLQALAGLVAGPAVPTLPQAKALPAKPPVTRVNCLDAEISSFGLAAVKEEGKAVAYDANFSRALWTGIKRFYDNVYKETKK